MNSKNLLLNFRVATLVFMAVCLGNTAMAQIVNTYAGTGTGGFAGDGGQATAARINQDIIIATDAANNVYIADYANNRIRKVTASTGIITTIAGTGSASFSGDGGAATAATLNGPSGVAVDGSGNVYIADVNNNRVRIVNTSGVINTFAGTGTGSFSGDGGPATAATLNAPGRVFCDPAGNVYVSDRNNYRIRKINTSLVITTFAGNGSSSYGGDGGPATAASFGIPYCMAIDASANLYLADLYDNRVRKIDASSGIITTFAGNGSGTFSGNGGPATAAGVPGPEGIAFDSYGNLYIGDNTTGLGDNRIRRVDPCGIITTYAGTGGSGSSGDGGAATAATFYFPGGVAVDGNNILYIADQFNNKVRYIPIAAPYNRAPYFTSGTSQTLTLCQNASATSINSLLSIIDSDNCQTETWSVLLAPVNGSLGGFTTTANANMGTLTPTGLTYAPTAGYSGTDSFKVTISDGYLSDTITVYVTINPLPNAGTITGASTVCTGTTITLTDAAGGGTWSGSTSIATVSSTGVVTGVTAGTVTISYTVTNSCGSSYATATITVNTTPNAGTISGFSSFCESSTITLTETATGGTWTSGTTSVATVNSSGVVTGVSPGTSVISYTVTTACGSAYATHTVTVNPMPAYITGPSAVCEGGSTITLGETSTGGTWSSSATGLATVTSTGVVTGVSAGTVNISYMYTTTGCGVFMTVTVNPLPGVITGPASVCSGATISESTTSTTGTWTSGTTSVATISSTGTVTGVTAGTSIITYALPTGCQVTKSITVNAAPGSITGSSSVCEGLSTTLASSSGTGTWVSSATAIATVGSPSGIVTGMSAGTANITYIAPGGCFTSMTFTVNPTPAAISGPAVVCTGSTINLTDASGSGTWSSSNTTRATVGASSGVVTGVTAGSLAITFTLSTGCLISSALTVNPTPGAISGPTAVCTNSTISLSNALSGGSWTSASTSIATAGISTGVVTGVTAGSATISYTISGCAATTSITVNPQPAAIVTPLGDTMLCPGGFVVLASSIGTAYTYQWYNGASSPISGSTDDYYLATAGANYQVAITNTYGCTSFSAPTSVTINPATATITYTGPTTICSSSSATLMANTGTGLTYQWTLGGSAIAGATSSSYPAATNGTYNVVVSNAAGCSATSSGMGLTVIAAPATTLMLTGPLSFCAGDSVIITSSTGTGYTYQWQIGGVNISGATNNNYTATTTGNYQVLITNPFPCTSTSATAAVNVSSLPSASIAVSGSSTFCSGGSAALSVPAVAGNTYQWYKNGILITGATSAAYTATTGGNFTTRVTSSAGCSNVTFPSFLVTELVTPAVVPITSTTFCWGGSAVLGVNISSSTGVLYQWQLGGTDITGATNSTYSAGTTGTYGCTVNIVGSCIAGATPVSVVQNPLPNPIIYWDGVNLTTQSYYVSYQWFRNLVPLSATFPFFVPSDAGSYTVRVIDTNGCQSVSTGMILTRIGVTRTLGTNTLSADEISIFPNPSQGIVHVVAAEPLKAVINAIDGRKIMEQADATEINISSLSEGIYTLMLFNQQGQMIKVEKLIRN